MSPIPYSSPSLRAFVLSVLVVSVGLIQSNSGYAQKQLDFNYTGRVQLWTVPSCVQKIKVEVWGAQGGGSYECDENGPPYSKTMEVSAATPTVYWMLWMVKYYIYSLEGKVSQAPMDLLKEAGMVAEMVATMEVAAAVLQTSAQYYMILIPER